MSDASETWLPVPGWDGLYEVSDRGRVRFVLNTADEVRRLDDRRAMVIDAHGIRYLINDMEDLDLASRRLLERYI